MYWLGRISLLCLFAGAALLAFGSAAYEVHEQTARVPALSATGSAPELAVDSFVVFDLESGEMLYTYNPDAVRSVASITKLFTAAAVLDQFDLEATTTLTAADTAAYGTAGRLAAGQTYRYRELLFPLLLSSSNDAARTLRRRAEAVGWSLPTIASDYGQWDVSSQLRLADASGLDAGNQATARDLAEATRALYNSHPYLFSITRLPSYLGPYHGWENNSPFAEDSAFQGGKHGFTNAAGRTAVAIFREDLAGTERDIGYVVLGSTDLASDVATLRTHVQRSVVWR